MPLDPSIISNAFANISMPDANALMQQRAQGAQNIYQLERQRQADAAAEQEAMQAKTLQALSPAVAAAFEDPSDAGLDAAFSLVPEEFGAAADAQLTQLRSIPDVNRRKAVIRSALLQDDYGRALLAQLEPSANMRLQEGAAARRAALDERRLALEEANLNAGGDVTPSYKEIILDDGTLVLMDTKSGRMVQPSMEGPIDTTLPPSETTGKPLKVRQKDGAGASESERIAAYNTGRALNAAKRIANAIKDDPEATAPGMGEAFTNLFVDPNLIRSEERQRVSAAQREMIDALLTLATGAAYNKEQLEGQMESYIPRWTDKEGNRADKRAALLDLIESAKVKSGRAWTPEMDAAFSSLLEGAEAAPGGDDTVDDSNPLLGGGL